MSSPLPVFGPYPNIAYISIQYNHKFCLSGKIHVISHATPQTRHAIKELQLFIPSVGFFSVDLQLTNDQFASIFTFILHPLCRNDHKSLQIGVCLGRWMKVSAIVESRANDQLVDCSCFYENWILRHYHSSTKKMIGCFY